MSAKKLNTRQILQNNLSRKAPEALGNLRIILHNVRSMHNVGSAFRSADAFGIREILLSGYTPFPPRAEISKTAIGAEKYVDWHHFKEVSGLLSYVEEKQGVLIGIEQTDQSIPMPSYRPPSGPSLCLVFGNEVTGIGEALLPHIDTFLEIPQYGNKHSLNVSVTIGVSLYAFLQKFWKHQV